MPKPTFELEALDPTGARAGIFHTAHGDIKTPIFMPVGTKATVKGITPHQLRSIGAQIILANTYHLSMRPGAKRIKDAGGLHAFERWDGPILTDSGGFQVFSLSDYVKYTDDGVGFRAVDYDGSHFFWTPEKNMEIAEALGADICMQLDICCEYPTPYERAKREMELSAAWGGRCYEAHTRSDQALFGIVQGALCLDLRRESIHRLEELGDFPGYGIGGYSVGEDHDEMFRTLEPLLCEYMPRHKPRYLMGVGNPATLVRAIGMGTDMFDCVLPTRTARMGCALTPHGRINLKHACYADDMSHLVEGCGCPTCTQGFSKMYLHHLVKQREILGGILLSLHNLFYLITLTQQAREAIIEGCYADFSRRYFDVLGYALDF